MRWDNLFDDLESQLEQELSVEELDLSAEEERLRVARLGIRDRLRSLHAAAAASGLPGLCLLLRDGSRATVAPTTFGRDWFAAELIDESDRRPACIVPIDAIEGISLSREQVFLSLEPPMGGESPASLSTRLGLAFVLRDLCRRRQAVELRLATERIHGTIDRVGRDHLDIAMHEPGEPRRESSVIEYRIVRLSQVLLVRLALPPRP